MVDYTKYPNPYDFANPVSSKDLFAGRDSIKNEIDYYLDQASRVLHPINLALLGDRASGKTSVLNIIDIKTIEKSMLPVRINLDEGDGENQFAFFNKVFNTILEKACKEGAFGGLTSKTYQTYLELKNTLSIPEDQTYLSFQFPVQYAHVLKSGNQNIVNIQDSSLQHDLDVLQKEVSKTIVITMDECNVLKKNKIILQKLRNIFMNQAGYMIIMAGTKNLFPVLDDVFSPIIRQFKKIEIEEFKDIDETESCILKPLKNAEFEYNKLFKNRRLGMLLREIHTLTHGKPYEIQLLCYSMFRRIQLKQTKHMALDIPVLEEVRSELRRSQQADETSITDSIESLSKEDLKALAVFLDAGVKVSLDLVKYYEYVLRDNKRIEISKFNDYFDKFTKLNILKQTDSGFEFNGDDFDSIYAKYYAKKKDILLLYLDWPFEIGIIHKLATIIGTKIKGLKTYLLRSEFAENYNETPSLITRVNEIVECINDSQKDLFSQHEESMEEIFDIVAERERLESSIILYSFTLPAGQYILSLEYYSDISNQDENKSKIEQIIAPIIQRGGEYDIKIVSSTYNVELPALDSVLTILNESENEKARKMIASKYLSKFTDAYIEDKDRIKSKFYSSLIESIESDIDCGDLNNLAYFHLVEKEYKIAEN